MSDKRPTRIIVLGCGFAVAYFALAFQKNIKELKAEIVLFDRHNYFIFYPLPIEAGMGSLEPRHAVVSIREFVRLSKFRMGEILSVDLANREVEYKLSGIETTDRIAYDHLVLAMGSVTNLPNVPGLKEYGFQLKSIRDAEQIRDRTIEMLEAADAVPERKSRMSLLSFIVVGGNFTGVEIAGELDVLLRKARRYYPTIKREEIRLTLIELSSQILRSLEDDGLAQYAVRKLQDRSIDRCPVE